VVSIIVPVYNNLEITKDCIRSIINNTIGDFEIIIIDNGSNPPVPVNFSCREGKIYFPIIIRNKTNLGFPVAVNQGIKASLGDVIVLLNNDVIVTQNWLSLLMSQLNKFDIVGPVTNYCAGLQQVSISTYTNEDELNSSASDWQTKHSGQSQEVNFVIGFCMAFKRSLYDEIGKFDESLWPCSGEEIDFCYRARQAGYKIGIAKDCYVHHEGSKTFTAMESEGQLKYAEICKRNDAHLAEKWGFDFWQRQDINSIPTKTKSIGDHTYGIENMTLYFSDEASLLIGKYCSIGQNLSIFLGGEHRLDWLTTYPFSHFHPEIPGKYRVSKGDVTIGNDVWIGHGVTILSGVTIGDGAVIGAGSVVASNVQPYSIVAGNPAKHIKFKISPFVTWWNWSEETIYDAIPILQSGDVNSLIQFMQERKLS